MATWNPLPFRWVPVFSTTLFPFMMRSVYRICDYVMYVGCWSPTPSQYQLDIFSVEDNRRYASWYFKKSAQRLHRGNVQLLQKLVHSWREPKRAISWRFLCLLSEECVFVLTRPIELCWIVLAEPLVICCLFWTSHEFLVVLYSALCVSPKIRKVGSHKLFLTCLSSSARDCQKKQRLPRLYVNWFILRHDHDMTDYRLCNWNRLLVGISIILQGKTGAEIDRNVVTSLTKNY
jgi:hypothetical protein